MNQIRKENKAIAWGIKHKGVLVSVFLDRNIAIRDFHLYSHLGNIEIIKLQEIQEKEEVNNEEL